MTRTLKIDFVSDVVCPWCVVGLGGLEAAAGLDRARAVEVLADDLYAAEVRAEEALWRARGITGVPAVVVEGKWLISGGQPTAVFEEALRGMAGELGPDRP